MQTLIPTSERSLSKADKRSAKVPSTGGEDGGVGTAVGGRSVVAIGGGGGGGRRGFGDEGFVVVFVDGVVEAESG